MSASHAGLTPGSVVPLTDFPVAESVLNTGQTCVCRDFEADHEFAAIRERARAAGLRSAAGLPLRADGKVFGVLCLYSGEAQCFDDEEVKLLVVLADDLAYCIVALRQRKELAQLTGQPHATEQGPPK